MSDNAQEIINMVHQALDRAGYRPFGSAGDGFEHPTGTRVTMGWSGGQVRVRRFVQGDDRFRRIPPVTLDLASLPNPAEVEQFVTPAPSKAEREKIAEFEAAPVLPESYEASGDTVPVGVVLFQDTAQVPIRHYHGDAGADLYTSQEVAIPPGEFRDVPTGLRLGLPPGHWARITGRSSTLRKRGLLVAEGVIDNGYTGPIYAGCWNLTDQPVTVAVGERVAQLILFPIVPAEYDEVAEITSADGRSDNGFGSSGQ